MKILDNYDITLLNKKNEKEFFALAAEYLPGSDQDRMRKFAAIFPESFLAMMDGNEVIGVAFGWLRSKEFPDDSSFMLDGIAVRCDHQRNGCGKRLLAAFEKAAVRYGAFDVSVGSAGGYVEKFYIDCGYIPLEYKVWKNGQPVTEKMFHGFEDYDSYIRPSDEGFVVMNKHCF